MELKGTGDKWSPEAIQLSDMKVGSLLTVLKDLRDVVFTTVAKSTDKEDVSLGLNGENVCMDDFLNLLTRRRIRVRAWLSDGRYK